MRATIKSVALAAACGLGLMAAGCTQEPARPLTPQQKMAVAKADPDMQAVLDKFHAMNAKPIEGLKPDEARQQPTIGMAALEVAKGKGITVPEPVGGIDNDTKVATLDGISVPVRVYYPTGSGPFPVLVYFHGGGWVIGSLDAYDASCRALCNDAHCVVVSVDYRQAPEHPFPAAVNDCYNVTEYVKGNTEKFKGDPKQVAVGGESAGGNLAVAVCLMAKDRKGAMPIAMLSIYPVAGYFTDTNSAKENAEAIPLNRAMLPWFYDKYLPGPADRTSKFFDVADADLTGLPPATIITDQIDPLHDDGVLLRDKLAAANVDVEYKNFEGVTHEFFGMGGAVDKARQAEMFAAEKLMHAFHTNGTTMDHGTAGGR